MKAIDDFEICPICGHDWSAHFAFIDQIGELLYPPEPCDCMECKEPFCNSSRVNKYENQI